MEEEKPRAIKRRSAKTKGRKLQKEVVELFAKEYGLVIGDDIRSSVGAETGMDIRLTSIVARKRVGLAIECKAHEALSITAAIQQADGNSRTPRNDLVPVVIFAAPKKLKCRFRRWICLPLEVFIERDKNTPK